MADFTITIENNINFFGPAPSSEWGDWNWGTLKWGEGNTDLQVDVIKVIDNSLTATSDVTKAPGKTVDNTITVSGDMVDEYLTINGWNYVFPDRATDAEDRDTATWTEDSEESTTWTEDSEESTTWEDD